MTTLLIILAIINLGLGIWQKRRYNRLLEFAKAISDDKTTIARKYIALLNEHSIKSAEANYSLKELARSKSEIESLKAGQKY